MTHNPKPRVSIWIAFVFIAWIVCFSVSLYFGSKGKLNLSGPFGDTFGAVNALFSGVALLLIVSSLNQQQKIIEQGQEQIAIQSKELNSNTNALLAQRSEMELQVQFMAKNNFNSQYFQLLDSFCSLVINITNQNSYYTYVLNGTTNTTSGDLQPGSCYGRRCLAFMSKSLLYISAVLVNSESDRDSLDKKNFYSHIYIESIYKNEKDALANYFRLIYHILKFIDTSSTISSDEQRQYAKILRAHLSNSELCLLFFNCLTEAGHGLYPLVEKYEMLKNITFSSQHGYHYHDMRELYPSNFTAMLPDA